VHTTKNHNSEKKKTEVDKKKLSSQLKKTRLGFCKEGGAPPKETKKKASLSCASS